MNSPCITPLQQSPDKQTCGSKLNRVVAGSRFAAASV